MKDLDEDRMELLERQLAERVTARVRPALFKLYASVGVAVIAALGFVSWDLVEDIKSEIKGDILKAIDDDIQAKRVEISERVTETRLLAQRASTVIQRLEKQLDEFQPQADNLDDTIEKVRSLNVTSQNLTASYAKNLEPLVGNVETLSRQLTLLAEQVDQLNMIAANGNLGNSNPGATSSAASSSNERSATIKSVIDGTRVAQADSQSARDRSTVFFQFAGGTRGQAQALAAALKEEGYVLPEEERTGGAAGKHEVRYFHDQDAEPAKQLAQDTTQTLRNLGYSAREVADIRPKSFVTYSAKKPQAGVMELWIEMPSR